MTTEDTARRKLMGDMELINASLVNAAEQVRLMANLFADLGAQVRRATDAYRELLAHVTEEEGATFICNCICHLPMGYKRARGTRPAPGMVPCDECKGAHR